MSATLIAVGIGLCTLFATGCAPRCQQQTVTFTWFHADGTVEHVGTQSYLTCRAAR